MTSTAPILVTGGTGTLGRAVVRALTSRGSDTRVLSRSGAAGTVHGDLATGDGLDAALDGVGAVLHLATTLHDDTEITRTLVEAAERSGSPRLLFQSIVGIDRIPLGYYHGKLACERIVEESSLPWTILRATQFHDLIATFFRMQRFSPAVFAPAFSFQPIHVEDVARRWVELLDADAAGMAPDIGGPETRTGRDLARAFLAARGSRRPALPFRLPGRTFAAFSSGGNLVPGEPFGRVTFEEFLASPGHDDPAAADTPGRTDA
ncbi:NAD(P)H-binding protein [Agromyces sp. NPDC049794]|uniref:SDR family oxidoreductase n=1 Tax=unclassified Agromyces TaxID=2639701 RepID=UPI0033FB41C0